MHPDAFSSLPVSCYRLHLRAREAGALPAFLGSTLRGAFGHSLKEAVCLMDHRDCARCLLAERCIYPYLFDTPAPPDLPPLRGQQQAPRPFVLAPPVFEMAEEGGGEQLASPPHPTGVHSRNVGPAPAEPRTTTVHRTDPRRHFAAGGELEFGLLLIGRAVEHLPYVVYALSNLARRGLGAGRTRFDLEEVSSLDARGEARPIYTDRSRRIEPHGFTTGSLGDFVSARIEQLPGSDTLRLRFLTPTRIRVNGDLQTGLSFQLLVRNLLRRVSLLMAVHGRAPMGADYRALIERAVGVETGAAALRWWDWERYSNRQQSKMKLGGFVGRIRFQGDELKEFLPLIAAGELLHVGSGTSFGLGRYEILD